MNEKQTIVFFVGPDRCGKTNIATELSRRSGIPYFKASSEHNTFVQSRKNDDGVFLNQLRYADFRAFDLIRQLNLSIILDRGYPCEWAYATILGRETDRELIMHEDKLYAALGASIVLCCRGSYAGFRDDIDPSIGAGRLASLDRAYRSFLLTRSKCNVLILNVDDEDLEREIAEVTAFLGRNV